MTRLAWMFTALVAVLLTTLNAWGQSTAITDGSTPLGLSPGSPAGSYSLSDFESINLHNGSLNLTFPLLKIAGRGGAAQSLVARLGNKWLITRQINPGHAAVFTPWLSWWNELSGPINVGRMSLRHAKGKNFNLGGNHVMLSRLTFTTPDGTEYNLRDQLTNGQPNDPGSAAYGMNRGRIFTSYDGSSATFTSDADITDGQTFDNTEDDGIWHSPFEDALAESVSGYLALRDGTQYRIDANLITWMRDRNGNKVTYSYESYTCESVYTCHRVSSITDSLNRQVTIGYGLGSGTYDQITFKGAAGATRTIKIYYTSVSSSCQTLFPELNMEITSCGGRVVSAIELPNGRQYQFTYNNYGEVTRIVLPTGGAIEYDYAAGSTNEATDGVLAFTGHKEVYRRVITRRLYPDGGTGSGYASRLTISRPETSTSNLGYVIKDQYNSSGTLLTRSYHYFNGSPRSSFDQDPTAYPAWQDGREYRTDEYAANGTTVLRRTTNFFAQRAPVSWWTGTASAAPPNDPRLTETDSLLLDTNQLTKQTLGYDDSVPYNNRSNLKEYDFGSGVAGALLRETRTTFVTSSAYTNSAVSLRSLPSQVSIYDGAGTERARTVFEYDNYSASSNHAALLNRASISGFDSSYSTSYTTRGNITAITKGLGVEAISSYSQYDIAGNAVKSINARGYATTFDFTDRFGSPDAEARSNSSPTELSGLSGYAFPSLVTDALGHTAYMQFDYYLGRPVDGEDANGIVASGYFNDPLDRPTKVIRAANQGTSVKSQSVFSYDDANRTVTSNSDEHTFADGILLNKSFYDGFGRVSQTQAATSYIDVTYDPLGRVNCRSNPHFSTSSTTDGSACSSYDSLSRITLVTQPDSSTVQTTYSGNTTTVTDEAGKKRKGVTDALGRLVQVFEDPSSLNFETDYAYDSLDDLTCVAQKGTNTGTFSNCASTPAAWRPRTFTYNSLSRLTQSTNPESGTISYAYDAAGNLLTKTSPKPNQTGTATVVATYAYDSLNRVTSKTFNDGTPSATFYYDSSTFWGAPLSNTVGRLIWSVSGSSGMQLSYDPMGRIATQWQCNANCSTAYQTTMQYDLAGNPTSQVGPSSYNLSQTFDNAGRLTQLTSSWSDAQHPASLITVDPSIGFFPSGALRKATLGNGLTVTNVYNNRLQPCLLDVNSSNVTLQTCNDSTPTGNVLDFWMGYGTSNNGNVANWNATGAQTFIRTYTYDSLNRLATLSDTATAQTCKGLSWTYDSWANLTDQTVTSGSCLTLHVGVVANNRLISPYQYDAAGNMTYDGTHSYTFDAENRLTMVDGGSTATYSYNASGQRTSKIYGGITTEFIYDPSGNIVSDKQGANWVNFYLYFGGQLVAEYTASTTRFIHRDHLGSTRLITAVDKSIVDNLDFLPFGAQTAGGTGITHKFTGKERDSESGLDNFGARYDSSAMGRFMSPDSPSYSNHKNPQSWNLYAFALNNPVTFRDADGHKVECTNNVEQCRKDAAAATGANVQVQTVQDKPNWFQRLFHLQGTTHNYLTIPDDTSKFAPGSNASKLAALITDPRTVTVSYDVSRYNLPKPSFFGQPQNINGGSTSFTEHQTGSFQAYIDPSNKSWDGRPFDQDAVDQGLPQANTAEEFGHEVLGHIWGEMLGGAQAGTRANMRDSIIGENAVRALDPTRGQKDVESHHGYQGLPPDKPQQ